MSVYHAPARLLQCLLLIFCLIPMAYAADYDGDGVDDSIDICVQFYDPLQTDTDGDGIGNACDTNGVDDHIIYTVAGTGLSGSGGDGGKATEARLYTPLGVLVDSDGNLYFADSTNHRIRKVDTNGIITTLAGTGTASSFGDGGVATAAALRYPSGVAIDSTGNLYIADNGNNRIRKVDTNGIITTVVGTGTAGFSGDGGLATEARLSSPRGVAVDSVGNLYIADSNNHRIRKVDTNGIITTLAGTGTASSFGDGGVATAAALRYPEGVAVDSTGNLYIADNYNHRIRKVDTNGIITRVAGTGTAGFSGDGGLATATMLYNPEGVAVDSTGNLYIADSYNHRIRKVATNGIIRTVAGTGTRTVEFGGDGGVATEAGLNRPFGVAVDTRGNLYIADSNNNRIRKAVPLLDDSDNDFIAAFVDNCPGVSNLDQANIDGDALGDACDYDNDNDGLSDRDEATRGTNPLNADTDGDGLNDSQEVSRGANPLLADTDGDTVIDGADNCPTLSSLNQTNTDGDAQGNICDSDDDNDGLSDVDEATRGTNPLIADTDGDTVVDGADNCPTVSSLNQTNTDLDAQGDACDSDDDDDGLSDVDEATRGTNPLSVDTDLDGLNDNQEVSLGTNPLLADTDSDGLSDRQEVARGSNPLVEDFEGDGVLDGVDNCILFYNPTQTDTDRDAKGDACDTNGVDVPINTLAGNGTSRSLGDGGLATAAGLDSPEGVAVDSSGNVYIADADNNRIRKVTTNGIITTVAGSGWAGFSGDGGLATAAQLNNPREVAVDSTGNLYIADSGNHRIRKVTVNGIITTVAGAGTAGFSGDRGLATAAALNYPYGIAVDSTGNLYIADAGNHRIRKVATNGIITTVAGRLRTFSGDGGLAIGADLNSPVGVAVDSTGNLYIADAGNDRIRKVATNGIITTVAGIGTGAYGGDSGLAIEARLYNPTGVAVDRAGNLYIADRMNHRIRKVATNGIIKTVVGTGTAGFSGDGGEAYAAALNYPVGVAVDSRGNLYIADTANDRIRKAVPLLDDGDNDFRAGLFDNCPVVSNFNQTNTDSDAQGDACDSDDDNDGLSDVDEATLGTNSLSADTDSDGLSDEQEVARGANPLAEDPEGDAVLDGVDNCIFFYNPTQTDTDGDDIGDACDTNGVEYLINTLVGTGVAGFSGDGGEATAAGIYNTHGMAVDSAGNLYIADVNNHRIRKVANNGIITTVAGTGTAGLSGDGGIATAARLYNPRGVAVDGAGNLYIADNNNHRIRKVDSNGIITTVAGTGTAGFSGDGGQATAARLNSPYGVAVDSVGNLYIADSNNHRIRKVATNGIITTVAGTVTAGFSGDGGGATAATFRSPLAVAVDRTGNLYIADFNNHRIRKVATNGIITTVAGNGTAGYGGDGWEATAANLNYPRGVAVDSTGNVYIADTYNQRIRKVATNGIITTEAGTGAAGFSGDGGLPASAALRSPYGVAVDSAGNLYIADTDNSRIRKSVKLMGDEDNDFSAALVDNCPTISNFYQTDTDGDGVGDACEGISIDVIAPVITLIGEASVSLNVGASYTDAGATATDDVDGDLTASIRVTGSVNTSALGQYTLTYSVTDAAGNEGTATRTVTVVDRTAPVITAPSNLALNSNSEAGVPKTNSQIAAFLATATAIDAVDGSVAVSNNAPVTFPVGSTVVTFTATDAAANTSIATATVTVTYVERDVVSPVVTLLGNARVALAVGDSYTDAGATAHDAVDGNLTSAISVSGSVNTSAPGEYTLTYTVSDAAGNAGSATRTVTVTDATAPEITAPSNITVETTSRTGEPKANSQISAFLAAATATDAVDGSVTVTNNAPATFSEGVTVVTFSASDAASNTATKTATVTLVVLDVIEPVITLIGEARVSLNVGASYTDAGATATDDVDGDLTASIRVTGSVNTATPGQYTLTYSVSDASGNQASATRIVTVSDGAPPVITVPGNISVEATSAAGTTASHSAIVAFLAAAVATDDVDGAVAVSNNAPSVFAEGLTVVTFTATDSRGNVASSQAEVTVTISDTDGDGLPDYYELASGLNPNDPSDAVGDLDGDGISNLDEFNADTDIAVDQVAPVFTAPDDMTVNSTGALTVVNFGSVNGNDAKDGVIAAISSNAGPFAPGVHTITWTVTDAAGNSTSDQQIVTVVPSVDVAASQVTDEGTTVTLNLVLNGNAASYPVTIPYVVTGTATSGLDYSALNGTVVISSGTTGSIAITTLVDSVFEGVETIIVTLGAPTNAVLGTSIAHTVSILEENIAPSLSLVIRQDGDVMTTVYADGGAVEIALTITDPNPGDIHVVDWSNTDNNLVAVEANPSTAFTFDPSGLSDGLYDIEVSAMDAELTGVAMTSLRVIASAPVLRTNADTDGDGVADATEGLGDADSDRVPDYLDISTVANQLPASTDAGLIQVNAGLELRLGKIAFELGQGQASVTEAAVVANGGSAGGISDASFDYPLGLFDFEVTGVQLGQSINIVLPLSGGIPANAVYRKYLPSTGVWQDFVVDDNNKVASAAAVVGACPAAGHASYTAGLTAGHVCVQLTIQEGGPNDTDGVMNGIIADPSGVATTPAAPTPAPASGESAGGGGSMDTLFMLLMSIFGGLIRLTHKRQILRRDI